MFEFWPDLCFKFRVTKHHKIWFLQILMLALRLLIGLLVSHAVRAACFTCITVRFFFVMVDHGRIQKISLGGPDNVFSHQHVSQRAYEPLWRRKWTLLVQLLLPIFLRNTIATKALRFSTRGSGPPPSESAHVNLHVRIGQDGPIFERRIVGVLLSSLFTCVMGAPESRFIEIALFITHNVMVVKWENNF